MFGGSTKGKGKLNSAFDEADTSATYRPCSAFDKGAMNFHLQHSNWLPNWQLKSKEAL
jgi:hypothetical protein